MSDEPSQDSVPEENGYREHDIEALGEIASTIDSNLRQIVERAVYREWIPRWKQPGWTTPAEYFLVRAVLEDLQTRVQEIERTIEVVSKGVELVKIR